MEGLFGFSAINLSSLLSLGRGEFCERLGSHEEELMASFFTLLSLDEEEFRRSLLEGARPRLTLISLVRTFSDFGRVLVSPLALKLASLSRTFFSTGPGVATGEKLGLRARFLVAKELKDALGLALAALGLE